jgi:hypothetical protein
VAEPPIRRNRFLITDAALSLDDQHDARKRKY